MADNKITKYRFYSNIRKFIDSTLKKPFNSDLPELLEKLGFTRDDMIRILMKRGILTRKERIEVLPKEETNGNRVKHYIKYTLKSKDFSDKIDTLYKDYIMKERKDKLNECDGGCACGCGDGGGAIGACTCGDGGETTAAMNQRGAYVTALGYSARYSKLNGKKKKKKEPSPENILGKTITAENKISRKVYISESQLKRIIQEMGTVDAGDYTYDAPGFDTKNDKGFWEKSKNHSTDRWKKV